MVCGVWGVGCVVWGVGCRVWGTVTLVGDLSLPRSGSYPVAHRPQVARDRRNGSDIVGGDGPEWARQEVGGIAKVPVWDRRPTPQVGHHPQRNRAPPGVTLGVLMGGPPVMGTTATAIAAIVCRREAEYTGRTVGQVCAQRLVM